MTTNKRRSSETDPEVIHETRIGAARIPLTLMRPEYEAWLAGIRADDALMADIAAVKRGEQAFEDLDEGSAGVFEARIFPHSARIAEKLTDVDDRVRQVLIAALLPRILTDLDRS